MTLFASLLLSGTARRVSHAGFICFLEYENMSLQEVPRYPPAKAFSVALRLLLCSASLGFSPFSLWRAGHQRMGDPFGVLQPKRFQGCSVLKVPLFFFFLFWNVFFSRKESLHDSCPCWGLQSSPSHCSKVRAHAVCRQPEASLLLLMNPAGASS